MKVCEKCGEEISTKDGENRCRDCEDGRKKRKARLRRNERDAIMADLGLTKVRGELGGIYYE